MIRQNSPSSTFHNLMILSDSFSPRNSCPFATATEQQYLPEPHLTVAISLRYGPTV